MSDKDFYGALGKRIEYYRKLRGWSLEDLARRIGLKRMAVYRYEKGEIQIKHTRLQQIADAFGIDVGLLYGEELDKQSAEVPLLGDPSGRTLSAPREWVKDGIYFYLYTKDALFQGDRKGTDDLLLVRRQKVVDDGETAVVSLPEGIAVKRVFGRGKTYLLTGYPPEAPPILFDPAEDEGIQILGKVSKMIIDFS